MEKSPIDSSPAVHSHLDRLAVVLSGACLVHCVVVTLLVVALPALAGSILREGWTHLALLVVVVPLSAIALPRGVRDHGRRSALGLGAVGVGLLILGATIGHHVYGPAADTALTVSGAILVGIAHTLNGIWCARAGAAQAS